MITVAYVNFWGQGINNIQDWWLSEFIKHNIDNDMKIINYNQNPDILIASCFGNINIIKIKLTNAQNITFSFLLDISI